MYYNVEQLYYEREKELFELDSIFSNPNISIAQEGLFANIKVTINKLFQWIRDKLRKWKELFVKWKNKLKELFRKKDEPTVTPDNPTYTFKGKNGTTHTITVLFTDEQIEEYRQTGDIIIKDYDISPGLESNIESNDTGIPKLDKQSKRILVNQRDFAIIELCGIISRDLLAKYSEEIDMREHINHRYIQTKELDRLLSSSPDEIYVSTFKIESIEKIMIVLKHMTEQHEIARHTYEELNDNLRVEYIVVTLELLRKAVPAINDIMNKINRYLFKDMKSALLVSNYVDSIYYDELDKSHNSSGRVDLPYSNNLAPFYNKLWEEYIRIKKYFERDSINIPYNEYIEFIQDLVNLYSMIPKAPKLNIKDINAFYTITFRKSRIGLYSLSFGYNLKRNIHLPKNGNYKLIHSSNNPNLKYLKPRLINSTGTIWYTSPRIYFSAYLVINTVTYTREISSGAVYEVNDPIHDNIEIDPEFVSKSKYFIDSLYVETFDEIPVSLLYKL